jgi:hypothetical protein
MITLVECGAKLIQRGSSDENSSRESSKGDPREGQLMKTPVEGRAKETDPSSR